MLLLLPCTRHGVHVSGRAGHADTTTAETSVSRGCKDAPTTLRATRMCLAAPTSRPLAHPHFVALQWRSVLLDASRRTRRWGSFGPVTTTLLALDHHSTKSWLARPAIAGSTRPRTRSGPRRTSTSCTCFLFSTTSNVCICGLHPRAWRLLIPMQLAVALSCLHKKHLCALAQVMTSKQEEVH